MNQTMLAAAAAVLVLAGASSVHAATATATASLHDLQYTLVDLDENDGVTPSITFDTSTVDAAITIVGTVPDLSSFLGSARFGASTFGAVASSNARGGAAADASISGTATLDGITLTATSTTTVPGGLAESAAGIGNNGVLATFTGVPFTLSANTELILTATADVSTTGDGTLFGLADIELFGADGSVDEAASASYLHPAPGTTLSISFTNASDAQTTGVLAAFVSTLVLADPAAAVPEPAGTALLATGLGLLGFIARKRRARG